MRPSFSFPRLWLVGLLALGGAPTAAVAADPPAVPDPQAPDSPAAAEPHAGCCQAAAGIKDRRGELPPATREVGIDDSRLNQALPLTVALRDEEDRPVTLASVIANGKPTLLTFVYLRCTAICTPLLELLTTSLAALELTAGVDFQLVTISIDPDETRHLTKLTRQRLLGRYGRPAATWHFLRGDEAQIAALTAAAGFKFQRVPETNEFAHPATLIVLTPDGRIARYLQGIPEDPLRQAKDIKLSLVEAADGGIGNAIDWFVLTCYHFDPTRGTYTVQANRVMGVGGGLTAVALAVFLVPRWWRDAHRRRRDAREG